MVVWATLTMGMLALPPDHHDPANALRTMQVPPGFSVQLFAAEPLVTNPTNMDIDERGRVWVTESHNYDAAPAEFDSKGDKVIILEDTNGDGRADSRKVFFEHPNVNAPMGLMLAGDKVFLSQSPHILILHDTDHDDRADRIDTLFTGMSRRDHGVHASFWGPDGKLYFTIGNLGKEVRDRAGKLVVDKAGNPVRQVGKPYWNGLIFRCNPDGSEFETIAHNFRNQFEPAMDSFGNLWVSDNDDDGNQSVRINYVMEYGNYGFADEITGAAWPTYRTNLEKNIPERHWHQNDPGVVPNVLITGAGSPAGLCVYEGEMLPVPFRNQLIHAEALHNVARAYVSKKQGAGFTATIQNLLKSTEQWCRPVDVSVAPDGSVMVADWYDPGIGGGTAADAQKGRIYRVSYGNQKNYRPNTLVINTPEQAAAALKSPNVATRYRAAEKLRQWQSTAEPALSKLFEASNPVWRARALWLLSKLPSSGIGYLTQAMQDPNPDLRMTALRALRQLNHPQQVQYVARLVKDPSPAVRRECAITLRFDKSSEANDLWATLAAQHDGRDRWYLEALGIGADLNATPRLAAWQKGVGDKWNTPAGRDIVWRSRGEQVPARLAQLIRDAPTIESTWRYFRAFDMLRDDAKYQALASLLDDPRPEVQALAFQHLDGQKIKKDQRVTHALQTALLSVAGTDAYLKLVEKFDLHEQRNQVLAMVKQHADSQLGMDAVQLLWKMGEKAYLREQMQEETTCLAIVQALKGNGQPEVLQLLAEVMLDERRSLDVRRAAIRTMGSSWLGEGFLLEQVKKSTFPDLLKSAAGSVLFGVYRNSIKREAAEYLPKPAGKDGQVLPPVYLLAYEKGTPVKGKPLFGQYCGLCHRVNQTGALFGPELTKIGGKLSKEGLFRAILYPDEGVNHGYETYQIETTDGNTMMGIVGSESTQELVLKLPGGTIQKVEKSKIKQKTKLDNSMMPAFGESLSEQELIDLVAYLEQLK
jgi:putative membrane-bound dehydrogenase-like protein